MDMSEKEKSTLFEQKVQSFLERLSFTVENLSEKTCTPDMYCKGIGYFECTVARIGADPIIIEPITGVFQLVSENELEKEYSFVASRILNRLQEKEEKIEKYRQNGVIGEEPCLVCLTLDSDKFDRDLLHEDVQLDVLMKLLYARDTNALCVTSNGIYAVRDEESYKKLNGSELKVGVFNDGQYSNISGLLFVSPRLLHKKGKYNSSYDVLNADEPLLAKDFSLYLHPKASIKLSSDQVILLKEKKIQVMRAYEQRTEN